MKRSLSVLMMLLAFGAAGVAQTAAKPNFAGTWNLNLTKSDLGQMAPNSETDTIAQTNDAFTVTIASDSQFGKMNYTFAAKLDGTDTPVAADAFPADSPFKILSSKAEWVGNSLVVTQKTSFQGGTGALKLTFTISDDGKTLTKAVHVTFDQNDFDAKSVYDKA